MLLVLYAALIGAVWCYARSLAEPATLSEAARFGPDLLGLVRRLLTSGVLSRRGKVAVGALLIYLVMPIDLVPDVIPLVGWADDLVLVVLVLRMSLRRAGAAAVTQYWHGSPAGLAVLQRLLRLR